VCTGTAASCAADSVVLRFVRAGRIYPGTARAPASASRSTAIPEAAPLFRNRFATVLQRAAIYNDRRPFLRQRCGDSKTNAGSRSRHQSRFVVELKIHTNVAMRNPYWVLYRSRLLTLLGLHGRAGWCHLPSPQERSDSPRGRRDCADRSTRSPEVWIAGPPHPLR